MSSISTTTAPTRRQRTSVPRIMWLVAALVLFSVMGWRLWEAYRPASLPGTPATEAAVAEKWGIRISHIAVLADGGLIDFRVQVLDSDKASPLFEIETRPIMIVEATGQQVDSLYHPPHAHNIVAGESQYLLYNDTGGVIKSGTSVSVLLGDMRLEHVIAQ